MWLEWMARKLQDWRQHAESAPRKDGNLAQSARAGNWQTSKKKVGLRANSRRAHGPRRDCKSRLADRRAGRLAHQNGRCAPASSTRPAAASGCCSAPVPPVAVANQMRALSAWHRDPSVGPICTSAHPLRAAEMQVIAHRFRSAKSVVFLRRQCRSCSPLEKAQAGRSCSTFRVRSRARECA